MAGHLPEHAVAGEPEHCRKPFRIRRLEIERQARIVGGPPAVDMVVCRNETDVLSSSSGPDVRQVEHPQRCARRQGDRYPKPTNHYGLTKGGRVYPCDANSERTPSSALPCCSTAFARRVFASSKAAVVRRCSAIRNTTTAPARSHGRIAFLNSVQIFIDTSRSTREVRTPSQHLRREFSGLAQIRTLRTRVTVPRSGTHFRSQNQSERPTRTGACENRAFWRCSPVGPVPRRLPRRSRPRLGRSQWPCHCSHNQVVARHRTLCAPSSLRLPSFKISPGRHRGYSGNGSGNMMSSLLGLRRNSVSR